MKYDSIILELLARIQALEEKVDALSSGGAAQEAPAVQPDEKTDEPSAPVKRPAPKVSTSDIRAYIQEQKRLSAENGEETLVLKASDIHRALEMKNRIPMVTNAMRQCMSEEDVVLHDTPSGKSSTLEIKYYLSAPSETEESDEETDWEED